MKHCNCSTCQIVPSFVIERMMKHKHFADKDRQIFLQDNIATGRDFRQQRANKILRLQTEAFATAISGNANRLVYSCENTPPKKRKKLLRREGQLPVSDSAANTVYDNSGIVRDYYKNQYQYNSVDNKGADLILNVHYRLIRLV